MLLRELSTEVKTNSYYKGRSAVYSLVTIVIFYASLRWSMMFSIFCPPRIRICVSIHPLPTDPFYCIGKFYEGINRRNKQKIYVSLRETCIRIGLFLILLANVYFIGLNVHHMNHETYLGVVKKKEICSDVNKYLFITKKMRRIIIRDY